MRSSNYKLFRLIWHVHHTSRAKLLDLAARYRNCKQVVHICTHQERNRFIQTFLPHQKARLQEITLVYQFEHSLILASLGRVVKTFCHSERSEESDGF